MGKVMGTKCDPRLTRSLGYASLYSTLFHSVHALCYKQIEKNQSILSLYLHYLFCEVSLAIVSTGCKLFSKIEFYHGEDC